MRVHKAKGRQSAHERRDPGRGGVTVEEEPKDADTPEAAAVGHASSAPS